MFGGVNEPCFVCFSPHDVQPAMSMRIRSSFRHLPSLRPSNSQWLLRRQVPHSSNLCTDCVATLRSVSKQFPIACFLPKRTVGRAHRRGRRNWPIHRRVHLLDGQTAQRRRRAISQSARLRVPAGGFLRRRGKGRKDRHQPQQHRIATMRIVCYFGSIRWSWRVAMAATASSLLFLHLSLSHIEISVSAGGFLSISSPSLPCSAMKLSPPRSSFGGRVAECQ